MSTVSSARPSFRWSAFSWTSPSPACFSCTPWLSGRSSRSAGCRQPALIGDPRWRGADLFLSLRNILPNRYPLTGISIGEILDAENYAGRLIDYGVILPRMQALYDFTAADLDEPRLLSLIQDGFPVYAWDYEDRHAWVTARARTARSVLSWLTSA